MVVRPGPRAPAADSRQPGTPVGLGWLRLTAGVAPFEFLGLRWVPSPEPHPTTNVHAMMNLEILPRLEPDYQCETFREAVAEMERRGASLEAADAISRIVESPFGGYRVFSVSRVMALEVFTAMAEHGIVSLPEAGFGAKAAVR